MAGGRGGCGAIVIGGGFFGAAIAAHLARCHGRRDVVLLEREGALLQRASYHNQARVHGGYHYPRSFTTAYRSRVNLPRFVAAWPEAVRRDFTKVYAIARNQSRVTARQFERFIAQTGAPIMPADPAIRSLFDARRVEQVYLVEEYAFDSRVLADWASDELAAAGVEVRLRTWASGVRRAGGALEVECATADGATEVLHTPLALNCTYSGLNQLGGEFPGLRAKLKQEITEMALVRVPAVLRDIAVTVMDGPFFSMMPFPPRGLHTLSHVRYTPHTHWQDRAGLDPYGRLDSYGRGTRVDRMLRDAARYLPAIVDAEAVDSLFEVKTVLVRNEGDDGRPILFEPCAGMPGLYSILGGKIDNIFDILERLGRESLPGT